MALNDQTAVPLKWLLGILVAGVLAVLSLGWAHQTRIETVETKTAVLEAVVGRMEKKIDSIGTAVGAAPVKP